jgi:hypothetical protein
MNNTLPIIGIILIVFVIVFDIVLIFLKTKRKRKKKIKNNEIRGQWLGIVQLMDYSKKKTGKEINYKLAIIEADKFLDNVISHLGFKGADSFERLKNATLKFPSLKKVWWTHKVCEMIVSDPAYHIKFELANKILKIYKRRLKELGAL